MLHLPQYKKVPMFQGLSNGWVGKTDVYEGHTMSAVWPNPNDKINNAADSLETITDWSRLAVQEYKLPSSCEIHEIFNKGLLNKCE